MSRISERISGILRLADSTKVTERKKCVTELLALYQDEEAIMEICQNTKKNDIGKANWPYIMLTIHKLIIDEAQKPGKETSAKNNERQSLSNLMTDTIRRAIEKSAEYLKSSDIIAMILQILDSNIYMHYQETYLGILVKYILPKSINHSNISAEQWRELLNVCTKLYKKTHLKSHIILDALQMIVDYSFLHTNLLPYVKSLLLFLERIFENVKTNNEQLIESFYKLSSSVCKQIMTESRIALCRFSENVSMDILRLNGSEEKYRLLLIFMQIHYPEGISRQDDGAYAYDWDKWNDLLRSMYILIQENCKLDVQWRSFVQFASEVVKQLIDNSINFTCSVDGSHFQSAKRRRTIKKIENVVDLVTESSPEEIWPLLRIVTETLRKYPQCLKSQDLALLLQRLTELAQSRDESVMDNLYNLAIVLMENEMSNGEEVQDATIHWSKIWDMLLRSLGANQNEESGHSLIRCFIKHGRMPNVNALLRLYLTKAIRWSPNSVRTLRYLCERVSLPVDASTSMLDPSPSTMMAPICDRTRLLEWLLNASWQKLATRLSVETIEDVCTLSVDLILSSRYKQNAKTEPKYSQNREETRVTFVPHRDIHSTDLSRLCHASLTFKLELLVKSKDKRIKRSSEMKFSSGNPVSYVQEALNFLKKRLYAILQEEDFSNVNKNVVEVHIVLIKLAFLARLLSALKQLGILITEDTIGCYQPLIDIMERQLKNSFEILTKIDWARCKHIYLLSITRALGMLYGAIYDVEIARIIVSASTVDMFKNIFDLLNLEDSRCNYEYYEERSTFQGRRKRSVNMYLETSDPKPNPREDAICLQIVEALASYCALHIDADCGKSPVQTRMLRNLLTMHQDFTNYVDSRMSLTILESLIVRDYNEIQRECTDMPLEFLLKVCQEGCKDEELLRRLLNLLPYFFEYSTKHSYSPKEIVYALDQLYKRIKKRNYSILVHTSYMKCACSFVRIDPGFSWNCTDISDSNDVLTLFNSILNYISDPLFVLRSQAIKCLQELLSFRNVAHKWKELIFVKIEEIAFELLDETVQQSNPNSQNSLTENLQQDEKETRTSSALIALVSVVCANGILQGRALCSILRLAMKKEVNVHTVRKVLSAAAQYTTTYVSLIEDNLNYLLTFWIEKAHYELQSFPWTLAGCETINEFFRRNINHIIPILLRTSDINETISFCTNRVGVAFNEVFKDVFPTCFAWLMSRVVVFDSDAIEIMRKLTKNIDEFADMCNFNQLLHSRLQDVLVELIRRLHDEDDFKRVFSISCVYFPATDPPHYSRALLDICFDHLESHGFLKMRTLVAQQSAVLQKTLLQLVCAVHSSRCREGKLKRLHQYTYFFTWLMRNLAKPVFDEMAAFLVRDVCYSLLHLTRNDDDETLTMTCCKFLNLFLRSALPARAAEVRDILRFIVANLIGLVQSDANGIGEVTADLLKFLIVEQRDVLREAIAKLGTFPNQEVFQNARRIHNSIRSENGAVLCFEDELEHFLDATNEENVECTLEDLVNLTQQLTMRKKELRELHRKLERPYPENDASILHRLIFRLIRLMESSNLRVSLEATKCLGEIGPIDSTMALRTAGNLIREADYAIEALTYRSVTILTSFLVENSVKLRKVSADALYAVLSTSSGRKLFDSKYSKDLSNILDCTPLKIDYIRPFAHSHYVTQTSFCVDATKFRIVMNSKNALWTVQNNENYAEWIIKVTCNIAECFVDSYLESFLPVCRLSVEFCEVILPRIIYLVIHENASFIDAMCDCINQFFRQHFAMSETETIASPTSKSDSCDQKIVRRMLDVVNHIRTQLPDGTSLRLDYVYLAKAAHKCSAYYTALLFVQLACGLISTDYPDFSSDPRIDYIYECKPEVGRVLQDIMLDTYLNISDPDATSGAGVSHVLNHDSRVQYYARTNRWDKVILAQDIELSNHNHPSLANAKLGMANALCHSGLQFLQWQFLGDGLDEKFSYECAWRLGKWDLPVNETAAVNYNDFQTQQLRLESLENAFHEYHYHALRCFHENDHRGVERAIECGRMSIIHELRVISPESSKIVNQKLSQLRLLCEIEQLSWASDSPKERYPEILRRWNEHEISLTGQFDHVEPILWQRITMFHIRESLRTDANMQEAFFATCLDLAKIAEGQSNFPVANRALRTLEMHQNLSMNLENQLLYQESLLAWMNGEQLVARHLLRNLIEKKNPEPSLRAKALRVYGDWMAETKSENPQAVIQKYYLTSINISETIERTSDVIKNLYDTQVALARFADAQYEQITTYMNSPMYGALKEYARSNTTNKEDHAKMMKNQDFKRAVIISQKQSTNDAAELKNIEQEKRNYLAQALKYYVRTLRGSEEHNLLIFRLIALWLDNMYEDEVNEEMLHELDTIPSFKFVPLVPQLAAHVSNDIKQAHNFSTRIFRILERCALEHPYHTLPVVLALKNLHCDDQYESSSRVVKKEERRVLGAKMLLKRLAGSSVRTIIEEMEILSRALVSFAYWQPKGICHQSKRYSISREQPIVKIKNLNNVLLPTLSLHVKPSGNYNNVIGVRSYQEICEFVGGVTAPKKIICIGTDGVQRRQLVKGKDDLRQDAVMQQVFTVMNTLLRTCKETQRRNLRIRTYKVVPLTQRSGVLEWCDNTMPISTTLTGSSNTPGMHKKYYPRDLSANAAREKLKNVAQESNEVKLAVFLECCKRMKPAFHHFFEEKYRSPETWVERTLTYTRSVATTSIAGYILGLGDRHLSNILIDEHTAEVVHIDFGVAFEQGKVLPIPEMIPFRLTRDLEVAMGASGIEGTMRRSCEVTMQMLRDQRQIIITLLQVLLYDPLFTWAITPEKACKMQSDVIRGFSENSGRAPVETNKIAKRALLRIEQKLQGTEDGLVSSVSGQVERLLQEARDPTNLCRIYCGWQPYL
ncbi:serine-protein kinase ATM isoform X1 [Pogonomyrmex barbatus]|uniref:non-specific serine/threonine protein kinase n=1 Tax=Pogonomyrmex barbatus TaxID=144034 RepID=A0A6I9WKS6_9HYME|nr:serine-protein kinase ATM isoform X1 [Pogonomyrmex barbatus]